MVESALVVVEKSLLSCWAPFKLWVLSVVECGELSGGGVGELDNVSLSGGEPDVVLSGEVDNEKNAGRTFENEEKKPDPERLLMNEDLLLVLCTA